jgi:hypothetical protein
MTHANPEQTMPILLEDDECLDPPAALMHDVPGVNGEIPSAEDAAKVFKSKSIEYLDGSFHSNGAVTEKFTSSIAATNNDIADIGINIDINNTQKEIEGSKDDSKSLKSSLYADEFIAEVDSHYYKVACIAVSVWMFLMTISVIIGYRLDIMVQLDGLEQKAPMVASLLLGMSLVSCVLPLLVRGNKRCLSGVIVCAICVQTMALVTDLIMATFPTPVLVDPITGATSYLMRYCEWAPLAFTMAFLTESCKIDNQSDMAKDQKTRGSLSLLLGAVASNGGKHTDQKHNLLPGTLGRQDEKQVLKLQVSKKMRSAYYLGLTQGMSAFCGWLFPFCSTVFSWCACMIVACYLFSLLWMRLFARKAAFAKMERGNILSEQEMYNWSKLSLGLLKTCAFVWSCLVLTFFVCNFGPLIFPNSRLLHLHGLSMMLESSIDVLFKAIYLLIVIDVHDTIFDPSARAERRLEELRQVSGKRC